MTNDPDPSDEADLEPATVGAVIVNFNGGDKLLHGLRALRAQSLTLRRIIVVDNGSSDGSIGRAKAEINGLEVIELGENRGLPAARNAGLRELDTELVLSLDSDIYLEPDCLGKLVRARQRHPAAVVCPRIVLCGEDDIVQCDGASTHFLGTLGLRHGFLPRAGLPDEGSAVAGCIGACLLFDRRQVLEAGGFDELFFFYFEDLEFSLRLRALGVGFYCEPAAVIRHDRGQGTAGLSFRGRGDYPTRRAYLSMRHRWLCILIHYRFRTLLVLAPALAAYEFATVGISLLRGWLGAWARAWWWLLWNRDAIGDRRRMAQQRRTIGDRDLLEGGPIPLAPGFLRSRSAAFLVRTLSASLNSYWNLARRWIG